MKIVKAKHKPSKREKMRKIITQIAGKEDMAANFDVDSDFREFCKLARSLGHKPKSQKLSSGGWQVWVY